MNIGFLCVFHEKQIPISCAILQRLQANTGTAGVKTIVGVSQAPCNTIGVKLHDISSSAKASYCIITTAANDSMKAVHDRMPLILSREQAADWIFDSSATENLLQLVPPMLEKENADAQLRFF